MPPWRIQHESHTCSETSSRITDVECIARAKTLQLNLTGNVWWSEARKIEMVLSKQIATAVQAMKWHRKENWKIVWKLFENDMPVLGLAGRHRQWKNWSRYAELIRPCIPYNQVASLDVVPDCMPRPPAFRNMKIESWNGCHYQRGQKGNQSWNSASELEVLHLFRCSTHTHLLRNILSNYWCGMHLTCKNTSVKPDRRNWMTQRENKCEVGFLRPCSKD